jgi:pteridine reductase
MKTILITGAAQRIGAYTAEYLHHLGHNILLHYNQSEQEARSIQKKLNQKRANSLHLIQADLQDTNSAQSIFEQIQAHQQPLDVIIHNASIFTTDDADWDAFFQIHVKTPYELNRLAYPLLKARQGLIINITDIHATKPKLAYSAYLQSKAAMHMQTLSLALDFAPEVRVNEIAPGKIIAPRHHQIQNEAEIIAKIPLKRRGSPEDIAHAVAFLMEANYITGQTLRVDGGAYLCS